MSGGSYLPLLCMGLSQTHHAHIFLEVGRDGGPRRVSRLYLKPCPLSMPVSESCMFASQNFGCLKIRLEDSVDFLGSQYQLINHTNMEIPIPRERACGENLLCQRKHQLSQRRRTRFGICRQAQRGQI